MKRLTAIALLIGTGCGGYPATEIGQQLFVDARTSTADENAFACSTCHSVSDDDDRILAGGNLVGVAGRDRYWGGAVTSMLDATNACMIFFMKSAPLERTEPASRALYEYLLSLGDKKAKTRPLTIVENVGAIGRGDPAKGEAVWDRACRECHGDAHTGDGRLTEAASTVPESSEEFAETSGFPVDVVIVEKIRHGAFFGVGGTMPPFSREALTDAELGQLLGFLDP